jgi:CspA family cold shock protein
METVAVLGGSEVLARPSQTRIRTKRNRAISMSQPPANSRWREVLEVKEQGTVKCFNASKNFAFLQRQTGEDVFLHFSAIPMNGYKSLNEGQAAEFAVKKGPKDLQAGNFTGL